MQTDYLLSPSSAITTRGQLFFLPSIRLAPTPLPPTMPATKSHRRLNFTFHASTYTYLQHLQQKFLELSASAYNLEMRLHQAVLSLNEQKQQLRAAYDKLKEEYYELEKENCLLKGALESEKERGAKYGERIRKLEEENERLRKEAGRG